jgi:hypothetical protein
MKKFHDVKNIKLEEGYVFLTIDGKDEKYYLKEISFILETASEKERNTFEVSPSGYGIHWPLLDEDISIDGLLGIIHSKIESQRKTA